MKSIVESRRNVLKGYCNCPNMRKYVKLLSASKIKVLSSLSQF